MPERHHFYVLVTGGRGFRDKERLTTVLDLLSRAHPNVFIIQGGAPGADALAAGWAFYRGFPAAQVDALWETHGRAAGPIRNGWMLDLQPDLVLAFPGGTGTADMVRQAKKAGVEVREG